MHNTTFCFLPRFIFKNRAPYSVPIMFISPQVIKNETQFRREIADICVESFMQYICMHRPYVTQSDMQDVANNICKEAKRKRGYLLYPIVSDASIVVG